tara:strand:- start:249 stop:449 length:201 start_codon:yes stop_codon:yes gene_type:complete
MSNFRSDTPFMPLAKLKVKEVKVAEVYKNDKALLAHLANPSLGVYLDASARICDGTLTVEILERWR